MKEIMDVLNKYGKRIDYNPARIQISSGEFPSITQEIEGVFRDKYNQYLVAEKGTNPKYWDFFDWLSQQEK